jgi:hypothetical protein
MMMYYIRFYGLDAVAGKALDARCTSECAQGVRLLRKISILQYRRYRFRERIMWLPYVFQVTFQGSNSLSETNT